MPTLQVRDLPEDVYVSLNLLAAAESRSIAQQTIALLKEGLGLHENNRLRRKALLEMIAGRTYPATEGIDNVALIREDRER
jgi:plasmid stability protein